MPTTVKSKKNVRGARAGANAGSNKKRSGRPGSKRTKQADPAIIANSIFALTLNKKNGFEIEVGKETESVKPVVSQLLKIYKNLCGESLVINRKDTPARQFEFIINRIKSFVPDNCEMILDDHTEKTMVLKICHPCDYIDFMPGIVVGEAVSKLKKEHPRLHDIFLQFLRSFSLHIHMDTWYNGGIFTMAIERTEEIIECEGDQLSEEDLNNYINDYDFYKNGKAKELASEIVAKKRLPPEIILRMLSRIRKKSEITTIIKLGCKLMVPGVGMDYFNNPEYIEENFGDVYLPFDSQAMIFYRAPDCITQQYDDWVNSEANEGVAPPIATLIIRPYNKRVDFEEYESRWSWPKELSSFLIKASGLIEKYTKK